MAPTVAVAAPLPFGCAHSGRSRGALVNLLPGAAGPLALIIAVVFAWGIKQAVIEPVGMAALMQVFFKVTEGQQPNPEWEGKLDSVSKKFSKLKGKATEWAAEKGAEASDGGGDTPARPAN